MPIKPVPSLHAVLPCRVIFEQISIIYALPRLFVSSFTLVLPFFPTGTMERVSEGVRGRDSGRGPSKAAGRDVEAEAAQT